MDSLLSSTDYGEQKLGPGQRRKGGIIANIVKAFAPVQIRYDNFKKEQTDSSADYKKMWSDLISTWNKNKNPGDDKK